MLPTETLINSALSNLLQAMKDNDDFFFEPLPLERQETIRDDIEIYQTFLERSELELESDNFLRAMKDDFPQETIRD